MGSRELGGGRKKSFESSRIADWLDGRQKIASKLERLAPGMVRERHLLFIEFSSEGNPSRATQRKGEGTQADSTFPYHP